MLDDIDVEIVEKLCNNGRMSLTDISSDMDLSRVAIANRIEKLIQSKLIKVSAGLNLDKLNYQTLIVELQVDTEKKNEFQNLISNCSKIINGFEIIGKRNFMLICSDKNSSKLRNFIENSLKNYGTDCKVTLASNPKNTDHIHLKSTKCDNCKLCEEKSE